MFEEYVPQVGERDDLTGDFHDGVDSAEDLDSATRGSPSPVSGGVTVGAGRGGVAPVTFVDARVPFDGAEQTRPGRLHDELADASRWIWTSCVVHDVDVGGWKGFLVGWRWIEENWPGCHWLA